MNSKIYNLFSAEDNEDDEEISNDDDEGATDKGADDDDDDTEGGYWSAPPSSPGAACSLTIIIRVNSKLRADRCVTVARPYFNRSISAVGLYRTNAVCGAAASRLHRTSLAGQTYLLRGAARTEGENTNYVCRQNNARRQTLKTRMARAQLRGAVRRGACDNL